MTLGERAFRVVSKVDDDGDEGKKEGAPHPSLARAWNAAMRLSLALADTWGEDLFMVVRTVQAALEEQLGDEPGDVHQRALVVAAKAVRRELARAGAPGFPIDPTDYAAIRARLSECDREGGDGFAWVRIGAADIDGKRVELSEWLETEFRSARYSGPEGSLNRQRKALRMLLERVYEYDKASADKLVKNVFDAPAKAKRRASAKARKP